jgi:DNA-directed RNA polymerase subunit RPC12/RpoP
MRMKPAVAVPLAIVLIAGAVLIWFQYRRAMRPRTEGRPVRCAACGHEFVPPRGSEPITCPQCGSTDYIVLLWYQCRVCGKQFVGAEERASDHAFRLPGGEWKSASEITLTPTCPECGSRRVSSIRVPDSKSN